VEGPSRLSATLDILPNTTSLKSAKEATGYWPLATGYWAGGWSGVQTGSSVESPNGPDSRAVAAATARVTMESTNRVVHEG
jgi:hypothetical protein